MAAGDILFASGFETSAAMDLSTAAPTVTGGTCATQNTLPHTDGKSLRIAKTANGSVFAGLGQSSNGIQPSATLGAMNGSFYLNVSALPTVTPAAFFTVQDGAGNQVWALILDTDGKLYAFYNNVSGTVNQVSPAIATLSTNTWYRIEWRIQYVSAGTTYIEARVDGGTAQKTANATGTASAPFWGWLGSNIAWTYNAGLAALPGTTGRYGMYIDDLTFFADTQGSPTWTGDLLVYHLYPDRSVADIDSNWAMTGGDGTHRASTCDECRTAATQPDGVTSYMSIAAATTTQRLPMSTVSLAGGTPKGVTLVGWMGSTTTSGTLTMTVSAQNAAGTNHAITGTWTANINGFKAPGAQVAMPGKVGGGAWDQTALDDVRFRVVSTTGTAARRISTVAMYVAVAPSVLNPRDTTMTSASTGTTTILAMAFRQPTLTSAGTSAGDVLHESYKNCRLTSAGTSAGDALHPMAFRQRTLTSAGTSAGDTILAPVRRFRYLQSVGVSSSIIGEEDFTTRYRNTTLTAPGTSTTTLTATVVASGVVHNATLTSAGTSAGDALLAHARHNPTITSAGTSTTLLHESYKNCRLASAGHSSSTILARQIHACTLTSAGVGTSTIHEGYQNVRATSAGHSTSTLTPMALRRPTLTSAGTSTTFLHESYANVRATSAGHSTSVILGAQRHAVTLTSTGTSTDTIHESYKNVRATSAGTSTTVLGAHAIRQPTLTSSGTSTTTLHETYRNCRLASGSTTTSAFVAHAIHNPVMTDAGTSTTIMLGTNTGAAPVVHNATLTSAGTSSDTLARGAYRAATMGPGSGYYALILANGPDVYYRLDETGSGPFVDVIAAHNATPSGTIIPAASLLASDPDAAAAFDPATTLSKATTAYTIFAQPLSIEFWVTPASLTGSGGAGASSVAASLNAATTQGWEVAYIDTTGVWRMLLCNVAFYNFSSAVKAQVGVKQHVVFVLKATTVELFINGASQGTLPVGTMLGPGGTFTIGGSNISTNGGRVKAVIDEVAIYKLALTAAQAAADYAAGTSAVDGTSTSVMTPSRGRQAAITDAGTSTSTIHAYVRHATLMTDAGTSSSTILGTQRHACTLTSSGTSTTTMNVAGVHQATLTSAGTSTSSIHNGYWNVRATSAGHSTSTIVAIALRHPTLTSAGHSTSAIVATVLHAPRATSAGTSTTSLVPAARRACTLTSAGHSTTTMLGSITGAPVVHPALLTSSGSATSSLVAQTRRAGTLTSTGTSATTFSTAAHRACVLVSTGHATSTLSPARRRAAHLASIGHATTTLTSGAIRFPLLVSIGDSTTIMLGHGMSAGFLPPTEPICSAPEPGGLAGGPERPAGPSVWGSPGGSLQSCPSTPDALGE